MLVVLTTGVSLLFSFFVFILIYSHPLVWQKRSFEVSELHRIHNSFLLYSGPSLLKLYVWIIYNKTVQQASIYLR